MSDIDPEDAARELDKAADALDAASRHLRAMNEMNAALHLAPTVLPSSLSVRLEIAIDEARRSAARFRERGSVTTPNEVRFLRNVALAAEMHDAGARSEDPGDGTWTRLVDAKRAARLRSKHSNPPSSLAGRNPGTDNDIVDLLDTLEQLREVATALLNDIDAGLLTQHAKPQLRQLLKDLA